MGLTVVFLANAGVALFFGWVTGCVFVMAFVLGIVVVVGIMQISFSEGFYTFYRVLAHIGSAAAIIEQVMCAGELEVIINKGREVTVRFQFVRQVDGTACVRGREGGGQARHHQQLTLRSSRIVANG